MRQRGHVAWCRFVLEDRPILRAAGHASPIPQVARDLEISIVVDILFHARPTFSQLDGPQVTNQVL